ncbi:HNH endonuclease signature motif containing protein [Quadrisphaera oryzae]|uniref:HNH endonuclease signature motif containing protein n=1 Tax=Quadrisphaera TaxID=317661 RepID=UPI00351C2967
MVLVHRRVFEMLIGPIESGMWLDHLCRVKRCCNPDHLEPVTPRENTLRGHSPTALNAAKEQCPRGHDYDGFRGPSERFCRRCQRRHQAAYDSRRRTTNLRSIDSD